MLQTLRLMPVRIARTDVLPPWLSPLVRAAEFGTDLVPEIELITRHFGFDSFTYSASISPYPGQENQIFEFTTLPAIWAIRYDENAYVEVDPRVQDPWNVTVPLLWDQSISRPNSSKMADFLVDALAQGIASGVCIPFHDEVGTNIRTDFCSIIPHVERHRENSIRCALGNMFIFASYFHQLFKRAAIQSNIPPRNIGMRLSSRERECVALAARGVPINAIGQHLRIDARLIQLHFDSIRSKLGVANSQQAIARAIKDS